MIRESGSGTSTVHLDTSFLVDLLREGARNEAGKASRLLESRLAEEELAISVHVACELFAGAELASDPSRERKRVGALCATLRLVPADAPLSAVYGKLLAALRREGRSVATMDLLIAAAALVEAAPLVTRNRRDFERIPGLEVVGY